MEYFAEQLADGRVVLAQVDWEPGGKIEQHWVRLLDVKAGETAIMDPWQPTPELAITTLEEHYCNASTGMRRGRSSRRRSMSAMWRETDP